MFEEEKDVILIEDIESENEDIELHIDSQCVFSKEDIIFEDCNILIDLTKKPSIQIKNCRIRFVDSTIIFKGGSGADKTPVFMIANNAGIEIEECEIYQIDAEGNSMERFIYGEGKGKSKSGNISIEGCSIHDIQGIFVQASGANVFMDSCKITNYKGVIVDIAENDNTKPSLKVSNCELIDCTVVSGRRNDNLKYIAVPDYWRTKATALFQTYELVNADFSKNSFDNCSMMCIAVINADLSNPGYIKNCTFKNCMNKNPNNGESFSVYARKACLEIENCTFEESWGIYCHAQYSPAKINGCRFVKCKGYETMGYAGIVFIFNEVDEQCIFIENCEFEKCDAKDGGAIYGSAMIAITAGIPEKKQAKSVRISKCKYKSCKCDDKIKGTEKQEGFFGGTIVLYEEK